MKAALICGALTFLEPTMTPSQIKNCEHVATRAEAGKVDPFVVVALGYYESTFMGGVESPSGAVGFLQVIPRYHCPGRKAKGCDTTAAGIRAYRNLYRKTGNHAEALARYNAGNRPGKTARRFANRVIKLAETLRRMAE